MGTYLFRENEREILSDFFKSEKRENELTILGDEGSGRHSLLTGLIYSLFKYFYVDLVFSYDKLTLEGAEIQLAGLGRSWESLEADIDMKSNMPAVFIAPELSTDLRRKLKNYESGAFIISLEDGANSYKATTSELRPSDIRILLERHLEKQCRRLREEQIEAFMQYEPFKNPGILMKFIEKISSMMDYKEVDKAVEECLGWDLILQNREKMKSMEEKNMERQLCQGVVDQIKQLDDKALRQVAMGNIGTANELLQEALSLNENLPIPVKERYKGTLQAHALFCKIKELTNKCVTEEYDKMYQKIDTMLLEIPYRYAVSYNEIFEAFYKDNVLINDFSFLEDYRSKTWVERLEFLGSNSVFNHVYTACLRYRYTEAENVTAHVVILEQYNVPIKLEYPYHIRLKSLMGSQYSVFIFI